MDKIGLIYNFPQHYRLETFNEIGKHFNMDAYFASYMDDVKPLNYDKLNIEQITNGRTIQFVGISIWLGAFKFARKYKTVVLLGDIYSISTWIILLSKYFSGNKAVLWTHGYYGKERHYVRILKKLYYHLADGLLLYGDRARQLMIADGFAPTKLSVIYNSVNYYEFKKLRRSSNRTATSIHLCFVGRLTNVKRLDLLLFAVQVLAERGYKVKLDLVGNGEAFNDLKSQVASLSISDYCTFHGALYKASEIAKVLSDCDICVSPGNVGLTAMLALNLGIPVISNNDINWQMPEYEAILNDVSGALFEKNDGLSLVSKILRVKELLLSGAINSSSCSRIIDDRYNPKFQTKAFQECIENLSRT